MGEGDHENQNQGFSWLPEDLTLDIKATQFGEFEMCTQIYFFGFTAVRICQLSVNVGCPPVYTERTAQRSVSALCMRKISGDGCAEWGHSELQ